jgi:hypothetical protein
MSDDEPVVPSATLATRVDLKPQRSQVVLLTMFGFATVALLLGAYMLTSNQAAGWAFVLLAVVAAGIPAWGWFSAQSDTDLHESRPTTISTADGLMVTTDSRILRSPVAAQAFMQLIEVSKRQRLPEADGLVQGGVLLPDSIEAANVVVQQINETVEGQARTLDAQLDRLQNGPTVLQRPEQVIPADESSLRLNSAPPL